MRVAKDAPGPAALVGGIVDGGALGTATDLPADEAAALAASKGLEALLAARVEAARRRLRGVDGGGDGDPTDNVAFFSAHIGSNPADLAISASSGSGAVGSTVKINVTIENKGPASSPDTTVTVTAPTGTELVGLPTNCEFVTAGKVAKCEGLLSAGEKNVGVFSFKIAATSVGNDGKATIEGTLEDPDADEQHRADRHHHRQRRPADHRHEGLGGRRYGCGRTGDRRDPVLPRASAPGRDRDPVPRRLIPYRI